MPVTDDEIREKYLERAIRELNSLAHDIHSCDECPRDNLMPVLGSGHPQADIMMVKYTARKSEVEEGVAFYGRSGGALMKSFKRLNIDPLAVYGTVAVKCPVDPSEAGDGCIGRLHEELAVVSPRIVVVMGEEMRLCLNDLGVPLAAPIQQRVGVVQRWTPTCEVLYVPDIDASLDDESAKRRFWDAFRELGRWYAALPPY